MLHVKKSWSGSDINGRLFQSRLRAMHEWSSNWLQEITLFLANIDLCNDHTIYMHFCIIDHVSHMCFHLGALGCVECGDCFFKGSTDFLNSLHQSSPGKPLVTKGRIKKTQSLHCATNTNRVLLYTLYNLRAFYLLSLYRTFCRQIGGWSKSWKCQDFKSAWSHCPSLSVYCPQKSFLPKVGPSYQPGAVIWVFEPFP